MVVTLLTQEITYGVSVTYASYETTANGTDGTY